jgi:hypothetical protein
MSLKEQTFPTQADALALFNAAAAIARADVARRNADDPDLNEVVTTVTDVPNKRYILTHPDQQDGTLTVHYYWK